MQLSQAADLCGAELTGGDVPFVGVSTDTRAVGRGELFVALTGPNFDGHEFLDHARTRGAAAAMVTGTQAGGLPALRVEDTRQGLGRLAAGWLQSHRIPLVAVTGSNGKTTVKEMIAAILGAHGPVLATRGNLNNDIGLPLTLLALSSSHRHAVVEMGANHAGEIAALCALARPDVGVVTLCAPAHLEGFGSVEGVARAKGEMFSGLAGDGVAVINADDAYAPLWREMAGARRIVSFGFGGGADVRGECTVAADHTELRAMAGGEQVRVRLDLLGRHNANNALAALAVAVALDLPLDRAAAALAEVRAVPGRLQLKPAADGVRVIDDTYNANPASLRAALDVLAAFPEPRWLALGNMAELGEEEQSFHAEAGRAARDAGVQRLFAVGCLTPPAVASFGAGASHHADVPTLAEALCGQLPAGATVLVKGSRSMRMERVVAALLAQEVA